MTNPISDTRSLGNVVRERRRALGLRQPDLALAANVGVRFIVDIENGKESCHIGLVLRLLDALGIQLTATSGPAPSPSFDQGGELGIDDDMGTPRP